jgi:hypothetical protein
MDTQTDMVKLIDAFLQLVVANMAKNYCNGWRQNIKRIFLYDAMLSIQSVGCPLPV